MSTLHAGTAEIDITPRPGCHLCGQMTDRVAEDIHDPLYAKAIVLSDGETTIGVVVCDLIVVPAVVADSAKARIQQLTGVPPECVLICATHTHTGPAIIGAFAAPQEEGYGDEIVPKLADAFALALKRLEPAEVAVTTGDCTGEVHNRRWHMTDGSVQTNPGYLNPANVRSAGVIDPQLGLLIVRTSRHRPIAVLGSLALHYVGLEPDSSVSADYFAEFGRQLQRFADARFTVALANGCSGDINNCDFSRPQRRVPEPYFQVARVANVVAGEAWKVWNLLREEQFTDQVALGARVENVLFRPRMPSAEQLTAARARLEGPPPDPPDHNWIYAREYVLLSEGPAEWEVPVQAMRVGDLGIVGLSGEVFCEIGLEIKDRSPFPTNMTIGLANGSSGYIVTDKALGEGGYETDLCRHACAPKGTAKLWADTAVELLNQLTLPTTAAAP